MKLVGDSQGIEALKALRERDPEYVKFLIGETRTNVDHKASFVAENGTKYELTFEPATGDLDVADVG